jgi:hypothetical protein
MCFQFGRYAIKTGGGGSPNLNKVNGRFDVSLLKNLIGKAVKT